MSRSKSSSRRSSLSSLETIGKADPTENTPLLFPSLIADPAVVDASVDHAREAHDIQADEDETVPLPKLQIFLLCYARVAEPIAFFSIFPYINSMIEKTGGIEKDDVGFYSGMIESSFSATQMCVMIFWGRAADRWGRKPCLVLSLFGIAVSSGLFGMSTTIWQMVLFRCLGGVFAGTMITIRAMFTENSTKKTQAKAFSYFAFAGNLGICAGPFIGGALESPAQKFGSIFDRVQFFHDYPYALPGFVTSIIFLSATVISALFLRETLHLHRSKMGPKEARMSIRKLLEHPGVGQVLLASNHIALLAFAYTAVVSVFMYTPVDLGGTGFSPELIASAIGLNGVAQALWLLLVFPRLHERMGTRGILRLAAVVWPVFFAVYPVCNWLLRHDLEALFWTVGPISLVIGSGVAMAFTATQLAVNNVAPTHETLGTLNSISLAASSGMRAFVPALFSSIFAIGVKYRILHGQLFWVILIIIGLGMHALVRHLPESVEGTEKKEEDGVA